MSGLTDDSSTTASPGTRGLVISLCFWVSLFASGGIFGAVSLSGKLLATEHHERELAAATARVEQLALDVRRLEIEAKALESDPEYIAAIARQRLNAGAMASAAQVSVQPPRAVAAPTDARLDPIRPWLQRIASCSLLRARLLTIAGALVLFAFTFLQERAPRLMTSPGERPA